MFEGFGLCAAQMILTTTEGLSTQLHFARKGMLYATATIKTTKF